VVYIPQAILYHEGAVHTRNLPYEKILMQSIRNRLLSYTKNAGLKNVCIALITQGSISLLAIAVLILKGKVAYALAFILAWINYAKLLPHTLKQRFRIQKQRRVSDIFLTKISKPITFSQLLSLAK
jgi:GT2 family glycosyltransferase